MRLAVWGGKQNVSEGLRSLGTVRGLRCSEVTYGNKPGKGIGINTSNVHVCMCTVHDLMYVYFTLLLSGPVSSVIGR